MKKRRSLSDYYDTDLDDDLEMATSTVYESSTEVPVHKLSFSPTPKPAKIQTSEAEIPSNGARNLNTAAQERVFGSCLVIWIKSKLFLLLKFLFLSYSSDLNKLTYSL